MRVHASFAFAVRNVRRDFVNLAQPVHSKYWQGTDVSQQPAAEMREQLNVSFSVPVVDYTLQTLREDLQPNLPWADLHFDQERIGGQPLNPGETWKIWPWSNSADRHRTAGEQFNHTYAERFWPKWAGRTPGGIINIEHPETGDDYRNLVEPHRGIRYHYADLSDVLAQLAADPLTRQAYIPIWFPEDGSHLERKPCTLGYHVIRRNDHLHMVYYIRSCDLVRHFQDDIYLAVRLQLWLIDSMRLLDPSRWDMVKPGLFTMHITSLHCFINDFRKL